MILRQKILTQSSKLPTPGESSTPLEKLQYDHAILYAAYQQRAKELEELQELMACFQEAFGAVEKAIKGVLK